MSDVMTMWPNGVVPALGKDMKKEFLLGQDGLHENVIITHNSTCYIIYTYIVSMCDNTHIHFLTHRTTRKQ